MPPKSIIFFTNSFPVLSQTFVVDQINGLIDLGHQVSIIAMYSGDKNIVNNANIKHYDLMNKTTYLLTAPPHKTTNLKLFLSILLKQFTLFFKQPKRIALIWFSLFLLAKRDLKLACDILTIGLSDNKQFKADSIIAHFGHIGVIANYLRKSGMLTGKLFTVFHGYEISEYKRIKQWKRLYRWLGHTSDLLLPISQLWASRLVSYGIPENKIKVQHMGIDLEKFIFDSRPLSAPLNILTVARATEKKGLKYALEAIEKCNLPLQYHIVGDGELITALKDQIKYYSRKTDIIFHGPQSPEYVQQALKRADIFLLPSVTDKYGDMEGIPVSLMEAMASGVIVISTLHSGIPELITHNVSGYLVPERNSEKITETINNVMNQNYQQVRIVGLDTIRNEFSNKVLVEQLSNTI